MMSRLPVAFRRAGVLFGHPLPAGELGLPYGRLTGPCGPDPDGVATFHTHEMRPGWVPSIPRGLRCPHGQQSIPDRHMPHRSGKVPAPRSNDPSPGLGLTRRH